MKRLALTVLACTLLGTPAVAGLTVVGEGDARSFDAAGFPPEMQAPFKTLETKCSVASCHGMGRTVEAIVSGIAPISQTPFDKTAAKKYGVKMMRMPNSGITKDEAKEAVNTLYFLIDESGR